MSILLAIALLLGVSLTDQKIEIGFALCDEIVADYDYDACAVQVSADGAHMWLHMLCLEWDPVREQGALEEHAILRFVWDGPALRVVHVPPLLGCPRLL